MNTSLSKEGSPTLIPGEVIRATQDEKQIQLRNLKSLHEMSSARASEALSQMQRAAITGENIFDVLMEACKWCSLAN